MTIVILILTSIFYPMFLYTNNIAEASFVEVLPIMGLYIIISLFVYFITNLIIKKRQISIITTIFITLIIVNFNYLESIIKIVLPFMNYYLIVISSLIGIVIVVFLINKFLKDDIIELINIALAIMFSLLTIFNLVMAVPMIINKLSLSDNEIIENESSTNQPNIYHFILDEYSNTNMMAEYFDYDNKWFDSELENIGFTVSDNSRNYSSLTTVILSNIMNYDYVVDENTTKTETYHYKENGELLNLLSSNGYNLIGVGDSDFIGISSVTSIDDNASTNIYGDTFQEILLKQSIFYPLIKDDKLDEREVVLNTFEYFSNKDNYNYEQSSYVATYLISPHQPFIFDREGNEVDAENHNNWSDTKYYVDQHNYISNRMIETMEYIKKYDPNAIILLQSDHGARALPNMTLEEKTYVLNALYYPRTDATFIEGQSGVNTVRLLINELFDMNLDMLDTPDNIITELVD